VAAAKKNKKTSGQKSSRWRLVPKVLLLLGVGGLLAFIAALVIMEQELNRIGFFSGGKRPVLQAPTPAPKGSSEPASTAPFTSFSSPPTVESSPEPARPPAQIAGQGVHGSASAQLKEEDISPEDKKRFERMTLPRTEDLSHEDRKQLDNILRSR
jgi:hypothetical protein